MQFISIGDQNWPAEHLGDGVYSIFDGFGIWLHANDHLDPTDRIYLEPNVFDALVRFSEAIKKLNPREKGGK